LDIVRSSNGTLDSAVPDCQGNNSEFEQMLGMSCRVAIRGRSGSENRTPITLSPGPRIEWLSVAVLRERERYICSTPCSGPARASACDQNRHLKHKEGKAICRSGKPGGEHVRDTGRGCAPRDEPAYIQSRQFPLMSRGYLSSEPSESSLLP